MVYNSDNILEKKIKKLSDVMYAVACIKLGKAAGIEGIAPVLVKFSKGAYAG